MDDPSAPHDAESPPALTKNQLTWQKRKASRIARGLPADYRIGPRGPHPPKVERICQRPGCGKSFSVPPSTLKHRITIYCSRACAQPTGEEAEKERFWAKVDKSGECWLWTGGTDSKGYGSIMINSRIIGTHVFSWELHNGRKVPKEMDVCHNCPGPDGDQKACCNPAHLWIGTRAEHGRDTSAKGQFKTRRKFTPEEVIEMRRQFADGEATIRALSHQQGCSYNNMRQIIRRETYKHVP